MYKILFCVLSHLLFLYSSQAKPTEDSKLLFVQILWRHGDRAPIHLYPNDPNPESVWVEGLGKLTMLGRKQHYALGKFFRHMYENFTTTSPNEVSVISSDCDRCMVSAEANLASFFKPTPQWKFDEHLDWQPIPVHYIPKDKDKYLEVDSICPRATAEENRVLHSKEGQEFIAKHKKMFEYLTIKSGSHITNWTAASYLYDVLLIEKKYNLTIPQWAEPYWEEMGQVSDLSFYWSWNSPLLHRLRAGPFLQRMLELMESKIAGDIPLQKFQIYSAHDSTIAAILDALNLYDMKAPPYCASLLFELHELANGEKAIRMLYQNSPQPEKEIHTPHALILEGCTEFCPLKYFINFTKELIPDDWDKECQLDKTFIEKIQDKNMAIGLIFAAVALIIIIMSVYAVWMLYYKDRDKYSYHLMPLS